MVDTGQSISLMLPPPIITNEQDQTFQFRASFINSGPTINLDEHVQPGREAAVRMMVIGLIEDRLTIPTGMVSEVDGSEEFYNRLKLESYVPRAIDRDMTLLRVWQQHVIAVPVGSLPTSPLEFMGFDVLMASTDQLAKLSQGQREALRQWTQGGGSLGISVAGKVPLSMKEWLNELLGGTPLSPVVDIQPDETVSVLTPAQRGILLAYPGVGRSALITRPPGVESAEFRNVMLHLWKVQWNQQQYLNRGRQSFNFTHSDWTTRDRYDPLPWEPTFDSSASVMTQILLPSEVSGVPLWLVCSVLGACFLIVVPGDYFVLGGLKLRRWTWLFLPAVAIGFSWYMIQTANGYMGNQDHNQMLTFVDLNQNMEPVRWNRFQLSFPATTKSNQVNYKQVFALDWGEGKTQSPPTTPNGTSTPPTRNYLVDDIGYYDSDQILGSELRLSQMGIVATSDLSNYTGTIPGDYTLSRRMNQWTPRITRLTSFEPFDDVDTSWCKTIDPAKDWLPEDPASTGRNELVENIWKTLPDATVLYWEKGKGWTGASQNSSPRQTQIVNYIARQTNRQENGLFRVLSQVSPMGTYLTEDLAIDTQQRVLVVITRNADESQFIAWRMVLPAS